jgi:exonuclease VII small subunit
MLPNHIELFSPDSRVAARNMIATMERVKDAVRRFEDGEINLEDALRQIGNVVASRKPA